VMRGEKGPEFQARHFVSSGGNVFRCMFESKLVSRFRTFSSLVRRVGMENFSTKRHHNH